MSVKGLFFDAEYDSGTQTYDRTYESGDFSNWFNQLIGNGVFPSPSNQLQVTADSGLAIIVSSGEGWIEGHKIINDAALNLTLDSADALLNRIDRVIFYCDYTEREMGIEVLKGTAAATPTAPALTRTASRYEMCLANIYVGKGVTSISQANITDTRADSSVCGWVAGLINQVDTSSLFLQWQNAYSTYYETETAAFELWRDTEQAAFDSWFNALTQELNVNTYIEEYKKVVSLSSGDSTTISLDMTGYTYDEDDIIDVYINGLKAIETTDYTLDGTGPSITVLFTPDSVADTVEIRVLKSRIGWN